MGVGCQGVGWRVSKAKNYKERYEAKLKFLGSG